MGKKLLMLLVFALLTMPLAWGANVGVVKKVEPQIVNTGGNVNVSLIITNYFDEPIKIKVVDKSVIGGSGYDIQCLEKQIESKKRVELIYPYIPVYSAGNYTLGKAEVSYVNPSTGKEEKVFSNAPYVVVKGKNTSYAQKTITTIYRCGGISMQSTSSSSFGYSSSTSFHISTSSSFPTQPTQSQQQVQQPTQGNQNIQAIKNALNREMERKKKEREEGLRNITNSEKIKNVERELQKEGYKRVGASYNSDTKQFTLRYRNKEGEEAEVRGIYDNGKVKQVVKLTAEQKRKMLQALKKNKKYIEESKKLREEGYNLTNISYVLNPKTNTTSLLLNYTKGDKQAQIIANYTNNTLKSVVVRGNSTSPFYYKYLAILLVLVLFLILLYFLLRKMRKSKQVVERQEEEKNEEEQERERRKRREAREHIKRAEKYLREGKLKEAVEEISLAIRVYYSNIHGIDKEVDSEEMIEILERKGIKEINKVREILKGCDTLLFHPPHRKGVSEEKIRKMLEDVKGVIKLGK